MDVATSGCGSDDVITSGSTESVFASRWFVSGRPPAGVSEFSTSFGVVASGVVAGDANAVDDVDVVDDDATSTSADDDFWLSSGFFDAVFFRPFDLPEKIN